MVLINVLTGNSKIREKEAKTQRMNRGETGEI